MTFDLMNTINLFSQVVEQMAPQSKLRRVWSLGGGMSAQLTALDLLLPDGRAKKVVVRQPNPVALQHNPQVVVIEFQLLQTLYAAGLAVPEPLWLDPSATILPTPYVVTAFVAGEMAFAWAHVDSYMAQMAEQLAGIHGVVGCEGLELPLVAGCGELMAATQFDESLGEGRIRATLAKCGAVPLNQLGLLHGDFWPGNVLWEGGRLTAVIDWEDAQWGDPLVDLAISRLDIAWIFSLEAMVAFTERYWVAAAGLLTAVSDTHLPYWDLCAALRFIRLAGANLAEWAAFYEPFGRHDITEQTIRQTYRQFVNQALAKLGEPAI